MALRNKLKSAYGKVQKKILGLFPGSSFYGRKIIPLLWKFARISEIKFWQGWIKEMPRKDPEFFKSQISPNKLLFDYLCGLLAAEEGSHLKILDVGAGPVSVLGDKWEGRVVQVIPIDPLAKEYNKALNKNNIHPHIKTVYAEAERLSNYFDGGSFDLVYAANSIDHCYNPTKALEEMFKVLKPGSYIYMQHYINEAENENYAGMHQWNFKKEGDNFVISNLRHYENITERFAGRGEVECELLENNMIIVKIKKS